MLVRQSFKKGRLLKGLDLNVPLCAIGRGFDALYRCAKDEVIAIDLSLANGKNVDFKFSVRENTMNRLFQLALVRLL